MKLAIDCNEALDHSPESHGYLLFQTAGQEILFTYYPFFLSLNGILF